MVKSKHHSRKRRHTRKHSRKHRGGGGLNKLLKNNSIKKHNNNVRSIQKQIMQRTIQDLRRKVKNGTATADEIERLRLFLSRYKNNYGVNY